MRTKIVVAAAAVLLGVGLVALAAVPGAVDSRLAWGDLVVSGLAAAAFGGTLGWQARRDRRGR